MGGLAFAGIMLGTFLFLFAALSIMILVIIVDFFHINFVLFCFVAQCDSYPSTTPLVCKLLLSSRCVWAWKEEAGVIIAYFSQSMDDIWTALRSNQMFYI